MKSERIKNNLVKRKKRNFAKYIQHDKRKLLFKKSAFFLSYDKLISVLVNYEMKNEKKNFV